MPTPELRFAYPLSDGGSEYSFGDYVWAVVPSPGGGWQITVEGWDDDRPDARPRVMAVGFATAGAAVAALAANSPPLYGAAGAPVPLLTAPEAIMTPTSTVCPATDRELIRAFRPTARVESRPHPRTGRSQFRLVWQPDAGQRADLGPWCGTEDRAWEAACLRLGLRLHRRM